MATGASLRVRPGRCGAMAAALLCLVAWAWSPHARADVPVPAIAALDSPVQDVAGALRHDTRARLQARARELRERKGAQLQASVVAGTAPQRIEAYAQRAFDAGSLGRRGVDDGGLRAVARDDRRARIQVGDGLEGRIPDAAAQRVLSDSLLPHLARGEYDAGVDAASAAPAALIEQEPQPDPRAHSAAATGAATGAAAWRPGHRIAVAGFVFALAMGWLARARGWPLVAAAPAALLPPVLAAGMWGALQGGWSALALAGAALAGAAAGGALGHALRARRWLRILAGAVAVGLAVAAALAALFCRAVPGPGDIALAMTALVLATPLLAGAIAPPLAAWQRDRRGCLLRAAAFAALAGCGWMALQRLTGGAAARLEPTAWLGVGLLASFAWVVVFLADGSGGAAGAIGRASGGDAGRGPGGGSNGGASAGGAGGADWSGGGRSGGGASGSW